MSITFKKMFEPTQLGTSLATIFGVDAALAAGSTFRGGRFRLVNTSANAVPVELDAVPLGGSAGVANQLFPTNKTVPANDYLDVDIPTLKPGDFVQGKAGTASVITVHFMAGAYYSS
ncbi:hypothetical protein DFLDMN_001490 [Cupriavidus sp. H19C3]|uniref:hypothetical protein n=1 Tax=Cupriavidus sp. H19C3 TaxID=3241603 RepID=UPI003BF888E8